MRVRRDTQGVRMTPALYALLAALLFGVSTPLSKLLLATVDPISLTGLLYLGAGLTLGAVLLFGKLRGQTVVREARLTRKDLPWLVVAVCAGGIAAPLLLLYGLRTTPAATASLLLNFEAVATALLAVTTFGESVGRRGWAALGLVTLGSALLTLEPGARWAILPGALLVLGACVMWGLDNNATRVVALRDPLHIAAVKGAVSGVFSLCLAVLLGRALPAFGTLVLALLLGGTSYGASLVVFVRSLRHLGAARTGALFGTAPFAGLLVSLAVFREFPTLSFFLGAPFAVVGVLLLLRERHGHRHHHETITHEHGHRHDDGHHQHPCAPGTLPSETHSHQHTHDGIEHQHEHRPDLHHRHAH